MDVSQTLQTHFGHIGDGHVGFFMGLESVLTEIGPFELSHFSSCLRCSIWSLCNQLLLQFSMDVSQTLQTYYGYTEDVHEGF